VEVAPEGWVQQGDGVFRGGGVKGLGLAGALLGFAEHQDYPITEWVNVAGASAGAIIASYLAVKGPTAVQELEGVLKSAPFETFEDYPGHSRILGGGHNLLEHHGFAEGKKFTEWFGCVLEHKTFAEVRNADDSDWRLKLVAVDVTTHSLLLLPEDLNRYRETPGGPVLDPDSFEIARAARMSMSIPYLFEPVTLYRDQVRCVDPNGTSFYSDEVVDRVDADAADAAAVDEARCPTSQSGSLTESAPTGSRSV
jgi:NTE family protein